MPKTETITLEEVARKMSELSAGIESLSTLIARLKRAHEAHQPRLDALKDEIDEKNVQLSWHLEEMDTVKNYLNNILESVTSGVMPLSSSSSTSRE